MKNGLRFAIGFLTLMSLLSAGALAVTPPYSENFEGGVYGDSVSTLGWRIANGDVMIGQNPGYGTQWGTLCMNGGANPTGLNVACYDFSAPVTTGQLGLGCDAWSVNYQATNGEFGFVVPEYNADWPGIRWIGGLNTWRLYVPDGDNGSGGNDWIYNGGGDQSVYLELNVDMATRSVWGAITDSTGRYESTVITWPVTVPRSISGVGYANNKQGAWFNCSVDNIVVTESGVPPPPGKVEGLIVLQDFTSGSSPVAVRVQLFQLGVEKRKEEFILDPSGNYSITNVPAGMYDVTVKAAGWLSQTVSNVNVPAGGTGPAMFSLVNGDANGDNGVTSTDVSIVLKNLAP